jgi:CRISPR-associated protein Cas1
MYTATITEIYNTQLNPTISYLHEPSERRFSLSLDISEVFKPIIVDRVIFKLLNKKILSMDDFSEDLNRSILTEKGRRIFLKEWEVKMAETIKHRGLKRNVSYRSLIRMECYKLEKHLIGGERYKPLVMWW